MKTKVRKKYDLKKSIFFNKFILNFFLYTWISSCFFFFKSISYFRLSASIFTSVCPLIGELSELFSMTPTRRTTHPTYPLSESKSQSQGYCCCSQSAFTWSISLEQGQKLQAAWTSLSNKTHPQRFFSLSYLLLYCRFKT